MTAPNDGCLWCYGTNYVHTSGGKLGDTIVGPSICGHDGRWRVVTENERPEHVAAVAQLRAHARRLSIAEPVEIVDITEPRHQTPAERDDEQPDRNHPRKAAMMTARDYDEEAACPHSVPLIHICEECGHTITADAPGWIKTNPAAVAERRDLLNAWYERHPGPRRYLTDAAIAEYPSRAKWIAVHTACDLWPEARSHGFTVGHARTERELLELCAVITAKHWAKHTALGPFIRKTLAQNADIAAAAVEDVL